MINTAEVMLWGTRIGIIHMNEANGVVAFEYDKDLSNEEYKVLKSRENLLEDCYDGWLKCDGNLRSELEFSVDDTIDKVSDDFAKEKEQKSKKHKEKER